MKITGNDAGIVHLSLLMRKNYIMTGDPTLSPDSAEEQKKPSNS